MRPWIIGGRALPVSALACLLAGSLAPALAQDAAKPQEPAKSASSQAAPPKTSPAKTKTKAPAPKPSDSQNVGLNTAQQAAATLRTKGEVVSQSGDLKISVETNVYAEFPGFDLSTLTADQRQHVIDRANKTYCTCGCKGDTVARCVVLDASCQLARRSLHEIINRETGAPAAPAVTPVAAPAPPKK